MDKRHRIFSDDFKKSRVMEIEQGLYRVVDISRLYEVSSTSVYQWLYRYGVKYQKGVRMVVEQESEQSRRLALESRVAELERLLGQKQVELEYLNRVIKEGDELLGCDLKKKFAPRF
jgi:transposase-like protein